MKKLFTLFLCVLSVSAFSQPLIEWQRSFGGTGFDYCHKTVPTSDGGYIAVGATRSANSGDVGNNQGGSDCWILKLDADGDIEWQRTLGGSDNESALSVWQTSDGGYIVGAQTKSDDGDVSGHHGNDDYWIIKLTATGDLEWQRTYGGSANEILGSVYQTSDGGYFVCGLTGSNNGDVSGNHGLTDIWVLKLDNTGAIEWQKTLGGSDFDYANQASQTADGGYIISGYTRSIDGDLSFSRGESDIWIIKLDEQGEVEWKNTFGGNMTDVSTSIKQTSDGGYAVIGFTLSTGGDVTTHHGSADIWVLKLDSAGSLEWQRTFGGTQSEIGTSIQLTNDGGFILIGNSSSSDGQVSENQGSLDCWLVRLDALGDIVWQKTFGGSDDDQGFSAVQASDGGFIFCAGVYSNDGDVSGHHGNADFWVVKLSSGITDIETISTADALHVFPNPASNFIRVKLDGNTPLANAQFLDISGKMIAAPAIDSAGNIDVSGLANGVYLLRVTDSNGTQYTKEIVKQ